MRRGLTITVRELVRPQITSPLPLATAEMLTDVADCAGR